MLFNEIGTIGDSLSHADKWTLDIFRERMKALCLFSISALQH